MALLVRAEEERRVSFEQSIVNAVANALANGMAKKGAAVIPLYDEIGYDATKKTRYQPKEIKNKWADLEKAGSAFSL